MIDVDRAAPRDEGEPPRGFRFPDPAWRGMRTGAQSETVPPSPFKVAVMSISSARVVPVVRRRGRRPAVRRA
jgi:hypothetical protein